jgi:hypothetical protein
MTIVFMKKRIREFSFSGKLELTTRVWAGGVNRKIPGITLCCRHPALKRDFSLSGIHEFALPKAGRNFEGGWEPPQGLVALGE